MHYRPLGTAVTFTGEVVALEAHPSPHWPLTSSAIIPQVDLGSSRSDFPIALPHDPAEVEPVNYHL